MCLLFITTIDCINKQTNLNYDYRKLYYKKSVYTRRVISCNLGMIRLSGDYRSAFISSIDTNNWNVAIKFI